VVVSGSDDRTVRVWDLATGRPVGEPFIGHTDSVTAVAAQVSQGRTRIVSADRDGRLRVTASGSKVSLQFELPAPLLALALSGRTCVVAAEQGLVAVQLR
jgi:WD40 repeat protein